MAKNPLFVCLECGKKFKTVKAAEKASYDGCPGCGGVDIDIYVENPPKKGLAGSNAEVPVDYKPVY